MCVCVCAHGITSRSKGLSRTRTRSGSRLDRSWEAGGGGVVRVCVGGCVCVRKFICLSVWVCGAPARVVLGTLCMWCYAVLCCYPGAAGADKRRGGRGRRGSGPGHEGCVCVCLYATACVRVCLSPCVRFSVCYMCVRHRPDQVLQVRTVRHVQKKHCVRMWVGDEHVRVRVLIISPHSERVCTHVPPCAGSLARLPVDGLLSAREWLSIARLVMFT